MDPVDHTVQSLQSPHCQARIRTCRLSDDHTILGTYLSQSVSTPHSPLLIYHQQCASTEIIRPQGPTGPPDAIQTNGSAHDGEHGGSHAFLFALLGPIGSSVSR